jgi:hypothetical protein
MYCTASDIQGMLGYDTEFTNTSKPTVTQVNDIITNITSEINTRLEAIGVTLPVTDSNVLNVVERYCKIGSAGLVGLTYYSSNNNIEGGQADYFYKDYKQWLTDITDKPELVGVSAEAVNESAMVSNQVTDGTHLESSLDRIEQEFKW